MKKSSISEVTDRLWHWYAQNKRTLPWRDLTITDDTERAYMILVSEVMLQQTQVARVIPAFENFLKQFPTIHDLAKATNKDMLLAWQGMGYNSRALRLRDAAKTIVEKFHGEFPRTIDELRSISGIGPYTAGAILNFAFNQPVACADTNIERIIDRVFLNQNGTKKEILQTADVLLRIALDTDHRDTRNWHALLMDFGSAICTKTKPKCERCPLAADRLCRSAFRVKAPEKNVKQEPGRIVHGAFIPNRIFRGRIIEALRQHHDGLSLSDIGTSIAADWSAKHHKKWLTQIIEKLTAEQLVEARKNVFVLKD